MKYKYITFIIVFCTALCSCSDYLDKNPLNGPASETYLTDESELLAALNGVYSQNSVCPIETNNMPLTAVLDAATDIGFDRNTSPLQQFGNGNADTNNGLGEKVWKNAYETIGRCNFILDNMPKAEANTPEKTFNTIRAEVRFVRAYTYHYLIELFGGVPLVTRMLNLDELKVPRSTKQDILTFIFDELEDVTPSLPEDLKGKGRASKSAALALKARVALYAGQWAVAAKSAQDVMTLNKHSLHNSYAALFEYTGQESKEIIWSHQYLTSAKKVHLTCVNLVSRNGKGYTNKVPAQALVDAYECIDGKNIDASSLYDPLKPFENRDPRLSFTVALPGSTYFGYQFETHKDSVLCWNYNLNPAKRVPNQDAINAYASFTGYCWRKYVDIADKNTPTQSDMNSTIIRYAEVLLIYAEAKIEANQIDQSVYDAINEVRQRKSVNMPAITTGKTQSQLRSIVRKERLYELANEGFRLYDIRRWKIAEKVMTGSFYGRIPKGLLSSAPVIDEHGIADYSSVSNKGDMRVVEQRKFSKVENRDYLWPIPERERTANPNLEQNPGY